jgi:hypothetical protein
VEKRFIVSIFSLAAAIGTLLELPASRAFHSVVVFVNVSIAVTQAALTAAILAQLHRCPGRDITVVMRVAVSPALIYIPFPAAGIAAGHTFRCTLPIPLSQN